MRAKYKLIGLILSISTQLSAQQTIKVNLSSSIRPVTHCASGSLYGMTESLPSDIAGLVAPLKPHVFCQPPRGGSSNQHPFGSALTVSQRLTSTTGTVQITLPDLLPGWPYSWPGKASWLTQVTAVINDKIASGRNNYHSYNIWNERHGTWLAANGDFFTECWKPTFDLIRSLDPTAKIAGPGDSYYTHDRLNEFLTFCKANNCLPDIICWHELGGSQNITSHVSDYRALETSLGVSALPICFNEYCHATREYEGCPGTSVPFIAKFERNKIESACISWWFTSLPGRLGSLLTSSNQKGGGWYLYKWYGDMTGDMVSVTPPNDNSDGIDGFACIDNTAYYASICVGGNYTGAVNVVVSGIPASFGANVNVKLESVAWTNKDTPVSGTTSISTTQYSVSGGSITVPLTVENVFYAYRVYITPVQTIIAPVVSLTSPTAASIFSAATTITLAATASDADGSITKVEFYNGNTLLGSSNTAPYTYSWTNVAAGSYSLTAIATDNSGHKTTSSAIAIKVNPARGPYGGTAAPIPGTIQFENYDIGGNGIAYNDIASGNTGGATFRTDEDVDIENCTDVGAGYNIGYGNAGEWLEYTVNVATAGKYNITLRVACNGDGRTISLQAKGVSIASDLAIPNTAGWKTWVDVPINNISLDAGIQIIRITIGSVNYVNLNYMTFTSTPPASIPLKTGWNLVGCPITGSTDVAKALSSVWSQVSTVKGVDSFWDINTASALNSLSKLECGKGYMIKVKTDCNLDWIVR